MFGLLTLFGLLNRRLLFVILLISAVVGPYLFMGGKLDKTWQAIRDIKDKVLARSRQSADLSVEAQAKDSPSQESPAAIPQATLVGPEIRELQDVLRFDITPEWITTHWSRVSMVDEGSLRGYRVPLMTGTRLDDLTGSLTYYFDAEQKMQRLAFRGLTGDDRKLVALAGSTFGLKRETSLHAGFYVGRWNRVPHSVLQVGQAPVVRANAPHSRLQVQMEINRPRAYVQMSPMMQYVLAQHEPKKEPWRW